MPGVSWAVWKE